MNQSRTLLVVGAHAADFVWRAAGVIAVVTTHGGRANVVALSYGERGESGELWKDPYQTRSLQSRSPAGLCSRPACQYSCQRLGRRQWFPHYQTSRTVPV